jgi:hypothetical protein
MNLFCKASTAMLIRAPYLNTRLLGKQSPFIHMAAGVPTPPRLDAQLTMPKSKRHQSFPSADGRFTRVHIGYNEIDDSMQRF